MSRIQVLKKILVQNGHETGIYKTYRQVRTELHSFLHLIRNIWDYYIISEMEQKKFIPVRLPHALQFPVNDICNSHCVMCNIWKNKKGIQISAEEIRHILEDRLFKNIRYVSLNGGEPTLRSDLKEIASACISSLPRLRSIGIITNGIRVDTVYNRCLELQEICKSNHKSFAVSISLDGIGEIHDRNRGVEGNYSSVLKLIQQLKSSGIKHSIGFTFTPINVYWADDVLDFCEKNAIPFEFRPGVDIKRILNTGFEENHPYTGNEKFHLAMFFNKLAHMNKVASMHLAYQNLAEHFGFGSRRRLPCLYWHDGVTLDSQGAISFCSTESECFGNAFEQSARDIFISNIHHRDLIQKTKCQNCYHHLDGTHTPYQEYREMILRYKNVIIRKNIFRKRIHPNRHISIPDRKDTADWKKVIITGWYGTETAGDKAILGELVYQIKKRSPSCQIVMTSINPIVSHQTIKEIPQLLNAEIIQLEHAHHHPAIKECDAVIIGGGPLMEISELINIYDIFHAANEAKKERIIFGCGVGPLKTEYGHKVTQGILKLATRGFFRDEESLAYYETRNRNTDFSVAYDPAFSYIYRIKDQLKKSKKSNKIVTLFRKQTSKYTKNNFQDIHFKEKCGKLLSQLYVNNYHDIEMLAMHSIWQGNDDRIFNREVIHTMDDPTLVKLERAYLPLEDLVDRINQGHLGIAMRYHAHIFMTALSIPYFSIDYTGQNQKISRLLDKLAYENYTVRWDCFDPDNALESIKSIENNYDELSAYLEQRNHTIRKQLNLAYEKCFD